MLTFLHISDLHFKGTDPGNQYDQDLEIREKLLEDLQTRDLSTLVGILVTGDIAYGGLKLEYERSNEWFEKLRTQVNLPPEAVFFIPGNHDVDREHLKPGKTLWESQQALRAIADENQRESSLKAKLQDEFVDFLMPLREYRNFAAQNGRLSVTAADQLAWESEVPARLEDDTPVFVHGLNSAILSNSADARANLMLSAFQFNRLARRKDAVNLVMCHHPPSWLLDCNSTENRFHKHAHLVLTGHEHESRCFPSGLGLRICAGAVHPTRGESEWNPGYNIIRLSIMTGPNRTLLTRVESRTWHKTAFTFVAVPQVDETNEYKHHQVLQPLAIQTPEPNSNEIVTNHSEFETGNGENEDAENNTMTSARVARLVYHFFQLSVLDRHKCAVEAEVWDDGDDTLEGQVKWARVFQRAQQKDRIARLWEAVASRNSKLDQINNPFTT